MTGDDPRLDVELAYTPAGSACRDPWAPAVWCRRPTGHDGDHAAGHATHRRTWPTTAGTRDTTPPTE